MGSLAEPFQFEFMVRAMIAAGLVGLLTGLVGVYIVLRHLAYIGHGLSHAVFGGAVVSFVIGINFYVGATVWGVFAAFLINIAGRNRRIGGDAAIGIITTAAFAMGVALISRRATFTRDFEAALFGEILGITSDDLYVIGGVMALVAAVVFIWWKPLLFTTFDVGVARSYGVPVEWVEALFSLVLAATVIVSLQVLGVTLIAAALVIPPVTVRLLTDSFNRLIILSTLLGGLTGFAGVYLSWFVDVSSGATVVLLQAAVFALVLAWSSLQAQTRGGRPYAARLANAGRQLIGGELADASGNPRRA
jgi:ABC-type Mn2+/Zn2+ transport system permease subunit